MLSIGDPEIDSTVNNSESSTRLLLVWEDRTTVIGQAVSQNLAGFHCDCKSAPLISSPLQSCKVEMNGREALFS